MSQSRPRLTSRPRTELVFVRVGNQRCDQSLWSVLIGLWVVCFVVWVCRHALAFKAEHSLALPRLNPLPLNLKFKLAFICLLFGLQRVPNHLFSSTLVCVNPGTASLLPCAEQTQQSLQQQLSNLSSSGHQHLSSQPATTTNSSSHSSMLATTPPTTQPRC